MAWRQDEVRNRWEWECEPDEDDDDVPQAVVDTFLQERQAIALEKAMATLPEREQEILRRRFGLEGEPERRTEETVAAALIQINEKLSGIEMNMRPTP